MTPHWHIYYSMQLILRETERTRHIRVCDEDINMPDKLQHKRRSVTESEKGKGACSRQNKTEIPTKWLPGFTHFTVAAWVRFDRSGRARVMKCFRY